MYSAEEIEDAQKYWSEYSGKDISREDAIEILQNLTAYVELLLKWDLEGQCNDNEYEDRGQ